MSNSPYLILITLILAVFSFSETKAQGDPQFIEIANSIVAPTAIANANDGTNRLFITEKAGRVMIYDLNGGSLLATPFLDIRSTVESSANEEGLLGITFDPDYANNGYFYLNYTVPESANSNAPDSTRIARYSVSNNNPNVADGNSEFIILDFLQPFDNHNGGDIKFGPDGLLYIPTGDGGNAGDPGNRSQNLAEYLGKILRVDVTSDQFPADPKRNFSIPPSNPYVGMTGVLEEILHYGVRNPWRVSFDRLTGDLLIADVGQNAREEVSLAPLGSSNLNFGWRCMEGNNQFNNNAVCNTGVTNNAFEPPIFEYTHANGFSITGGYVYRGNVFADFFGWYFCIDFVTNRLYMLQETSPGNWISVNQGNNNGISETSSFGESESGELYAISLTNNRLYRLIDQDACPNTQNIANVINPVHGAIQNITSNAIVPTNTTLGFGAEDCVQLNAGFSTPASTQFEAFLELCGGL